MDNLKYLRYHNSKVNNLKEVIKRFIYFFGKIIFFWKRRNIPYSEFKKTKKILFITLYFRGDVLFHTPVIKLLKNLFPDSEIDVWVKPRSAEILNGNRDVREILDFDSLKTADYSEEHLRLDLKGKWNFLKKLRARKYELIIDYTGLYATTFFGFLAGAKYSAGKNQQGFGFLYNNTINIDLSVISGNLIIKYMGMLKELLLVDDLTWDEIIKTVPPKPVLYNNPDIKEQIENELRSRDFDLQKSLVCIHLTAGWEAKRWSLNNFTDLIKILLLDCNCEVAVIGGEYDKKEFQKVVKDLKEFFDVEKLNNMFFSFPLHYNAELLRMSDLFIGSDSAPLHIAGAVDTPSIGLFGPTNPEFSNPLGKDHYIIYNRLYCSSKTNEQFCSRNAGKTCPTVDCMKLISVQDILDKIKMINPNLLKMNTQIN